jgi:putative ABC transport system ATP-binding protein
MNMANETMTPRDGTPARTSRNLAEHQTALKNVADGLPYASVGAREQRGPAADALASVRLAHRIAFRPWQLSGGERQRIAIACARRPTRDRARRRADRTSTQAPARRSSSLLRELNDQGATIAAITHERELGARLPRQIEMLDARDRLRQRNRKRGP